MEKISFDGKGLQKTPLLIHMEQLYSVNKKEFITQKITIDKYKCIQSVESEVVSTY